MNLYPVYLYRNLPFQLYYRTYGSWYDATHVKKCIYYYWEFTDSDLIRTTISCHLYNGKHMEVRIDPNEGYIKFSKRVFESFRKFPLVTRPVTGFDGRFLFNTYRYVPKYTKKIKIKLGSIHKGKTNPFHDNIIDE